jgi:predicted nucleotidyltransferase
MNTKPKSAPILLLQARRYDVLAAATRHRASNVRVFGSVARGDDDANSDIDLLVDFSASASLLDLVALKRELEQMLGRPTDVVTVDGVSPLLRERILAEARPL